MSETGPYAIQLRRTVGGVPAWALWGNEPDKQYGIDQIGALERSAQGLRQDPKYAATCSEAYRLVDMADGRVVYPPEMEGEDALASLPFSLEPFEVQGFYPPHRYRGESARKWAKHSTHATLATAQRVQRDRAKIDPASDMANAWRVVCARTGEVLVPAIQSGDPNAAGLDLKIAKLLRSAADLYEKAGKSKTIASRIKAEDRALRAFEAVEREIKGDVF